jgi:two-component system, chemotaxis family, chemotaxis protein CheY
MNRRILVIDDAEHLRAILKLTLEFGGYEVVDAGDGREGMAAAQAGPFDLIFCDIEMPAMNGIEFVRQYRRDISPSTPIIMLTAEGDELIRRAMEAGATGVIKKPFEPMVLLDLIGKHLAEA